MNEPVDLSDVLTAIEVHRRVSLGLNQDITPRLISWGLVALARENPGANLGEDWLSLNSSQQWRRVRMRLSDRALIALHEILKSERAASGQKTD